MGGLPAQPTISKVLFRFKQQISCFLYSGRAGVPIIVRLDAEYK